MSRGRTKWKWNSVAINFASRQQRGQSRRIRNVICVLHTLVPYLSALYPGLTAGHTHTHQHTQRLAIKLAVCASVTKFENARNHLLVLFDSRRKIVADSLRFKDQNFETNLGRIPGVPLM